MGGNICGFRNLEDFRLINFQNLEINAFAVTKRGAAMISKKDIKRARKLVATNFRGMIPPKYINEIIKFAPSEEWKLLPVKGNEILHGQKEGRPDAILYWSKDGKQIECTRMGAVLWYCFRHYHEEVPL